MELNEKVISDDNLTVEGIKNALQPFCDKYLTGRSMYSRDWLGGAERRFVAFVKKVFGPDWTLSGGYYMDPIILTKDGWKIRIDLKNRQQEGGDRMHHGYWTDGAGRKQPPRAEFFTEVRIEDSPAIRKEKEDRINKENADREDVLKNNQPDEKDLQRVNDIIDRFGNDHYRCMSHLYAMARTIKSKSKALKRGVAAYNALIEKGFDERDARDVLRSFRVAASQATNESASFKGVHKSCLMESLHKMA